MVEENRKEDFLESNELVLDAGFKMPESKDLVSNEGFAAPDTNAFGNTFR